MEALALRCRSDQSKEYISEALLCYRSGAYRATIVSTWIAVVFDLIDKIRELALSGDANAKVLENQYERYLQQIEQQSEQGIRSALQFERDILTTCKNQLQLFDQQQLTDLNRLREDRHRCAHPSFQKIGEPYRPSAEQARLHVRNAVLHVLAQPPVQGRAALAELTALVSSNYFPIETAKAVTQLQSSPLAKPSDALVRGFIDELIFGFFNANHSLYHKRQVMSAINAGLELYRPLVEARLSKQLGKVVRDQPDQEFPYAAVFVSHISASWSFLDGPAKDKVVEFISNGKASEVIRVLSILSKVDALKAVVEKRIGVLTFEELSEAVATYRLRDAGKNRAIELLSESHSWTRVNNVMDKLILPLFDLLDHTDTERIIRLPITTGADMIGAGGYGTFIERVRGSALFKPDDLNSLLKENRASYLVESDLS
jgi:hypothetical protein